MTTPLSRTRRHALRHLASLAGSVSLAYVLLRAGCAALSAELCGNTVMKTIRSPDGAVDAVLFQRDCGATTGYSEQVSLVPAGAGLPNEGGNVFVADGDHGTAPKGPELTLSWQDDGALLITHHPKARTFHQAYRALVWVRGVVPRFVPVRYAAHPPREVTPPGHPSGR